MARVYALVGVAVCMVAVLIGCQTSEIGGFLAFNPDASNRVVSGFHGKVVLDTHQALTKLGFKVDEPMYDAGKDTYYLTSKTKNGNQFKVVLTRDQHDPNEKTHMQLEWVGQQDGSNFGLHLLADVGKKNT
jgi:hypothetical protein